MQLTPLHKVVKAQFHNSISDRATIAEATDVCLQQIDSALLSSKEFPVCVELRSCLEQRNYKAIWGKIFAAVVLAVRAHGYHTKKYGGTVLNISDVPLTQ